MAQTHDLGNLFAHTVRLKPDSPLVHRAVTNEIEVPYRTSQSWVFRIPKTTYGVVLGRWIKTERSETEALGFALRGNLARGLSQDKWVGEFDFSNMPSGVSDSDLGRMTLGDYVVNRDFILKNTAQFRNTEEEKRKVLALIRQQYRSDAERRCAAEALGLEKEYEATRESAKEIPVESKNKTAETE
jgi:hypothetical protein